MSLSVFSELGKLRRVLIHRPGLEIDRMVPSMMERLLFDDILHGADAREEHDAFRAVLEAAGVETLDPEVLLGEVLADKAVATALLDELTAEPGIKAELLAELRTLAPPDLATTLVTGIPTANEPPSWRLHSFYRLPPIPNYFFQRDPQVVLGDRVLASAMATEARHREPLLSRIAFAHHPALSGHADLIVPEVESVTGTQRAVAIEGGDILVASPEVLLVGLSERTNRWGIEHLARYLRRNRTRFRSLIVVELPNRRSYMHLDTVFTFINHGLCLAYMPVIAPGGAEEGHVYRIDLQSRELSYVLRDSLPQALAEVGIDIELVPCGGSSSIIDQQREQWTDGANAFAIAPGVIVLYGRNWRTTEELDRRGWRVLTEKEVIDGKAQLLGAGPTVVALHGHELSRARGGPRCMTMPLERDPVDT